jgi:hypothetical protein
MWYGGHGSPARFTAGKDAWQLQRAAVGVQHVVSGMRVLVDSVLEWTIRLPGEREPVADILDPVGSHQAVLWEASS